MQTIAEDFFIADLLPYRAPRRQLERTDSLYREADVELEGGEAVMDQRVCCEEVEILSEVLLGLQDVLAGET